MTKPIAKPMSEINKAELKAKLESDGWTDKAINAAAIVPKIPSVKFFTPYDIIRCKAHGGGYRVWQVGGILLGATYQESVVELKTLDRVCYAKDSLMFVPMQILEAAVECGTFEYIKVHNHE